MSRNNNTPQAVIIATRLLWAVVLIGLINYCWDYMKPGDGMVHSATTLVISSIFLIFFVAFVNYYLLKAKNWVRWFALIFTLISLPAFFLPEVQSSPTNLLFGIITTALEFTAIYLVFSGPSKSWFK